MKLRSIAAICAIAAAAGCSPPAGPPPRNREEVAAAPEPASAAPASAAPAGEAGRPATRRDPADDRALTKSPEAFSAYAEAAALERRLPLVAAAQFRRALQLDPSFHAARLRLALADTQISGREELIRSLDGIGAGSATLPETYRAAEETLRRLAEGDNERALSSVTAALSRHPDDADLHYLAGLVRGCSCDHFDPDAVVAHLERALEPDPDFPLARRRLVEAYALKGMNDWALSRAAEYREAHPDRPEAAAEVAWVQAARGQYGDALEIADDLIRGGAELLPLGLGPAFILSGHEEQLDAMFDPERERSETTSRNATTHLHMGIARFHAGRFDLALTHFERAPEFLPAPWERPEKALHFLLQARVLDRQGRGREALAALEAARQIVGAHPALEYLTGAIGLRHGDRREAERAHNRLSQERRRGRPGWTEPWRRLLAAEISLADGHPFEALEEARSAWTLEDPLSSDCLLRRTDAAFLDVVARAALEARRPEEALRATEQIRSLGLAGLLHPDLMVLADFRAGAALEALGRPEEALARFRQFVSAWGKASSPSSEVAAARASLSDTPAGDDDR